MNAALFLRVSTERQDETNQLPELEAFATHHGYTVKAVYSVSESAWRVKENGEYRKAIDCALDAAWRGEFSTLIVWAADRLTRGGAEDLLRLIRQFRQRGCTVLSVKESWLNTSPEVQDLLVAFAGWQAAQESARRSERIRTAISARRAKGTWQGRGPDVGKRRTKGYRGNRNAVRS